MATLPIVSGPQVQPQGGGQYLQTRVDPRAFGAATASALGQFGQTIQQTAQVVQQISLRRDDADYMAALSTARDRVRERLYNPENGVYTRAGANALGSQTELDNFYRELEAELLPTLQSPAAQRAFTRAMMNDRQQTLGQTASFEMQEMERYRTGSAVALVNTAVERAYQGWNNPEIIAQSIQEARQAVAVSTLGQSPEATRLAELDATSRIHTAVITQMMTSDAIAANTYYQSNIGQLTAQDSSAIQRALAPAMYQAELAGAQSRLGAAMGAEAAALPMIPLSPQGEAAVAARTGAPYNTTVAPETSTFLNERRVGGGVHFEGMNPVFMNRASEVLRLAEEATGSRAVIWSGYRSAEEQAQLYTNYLITVGRLPRDGTYTYNGVAYRWSEEKGEIALAAPPGSSRHQGGNAFDIGAGPVLDWMRANQLMLKERYGIEFLQGSAGIVDPGHMQLAGTAPTTDPGGHPQLPPVAQPEGTEPETATITIRQTDLTEAPRLAFQQNLEAFGNDIEAAIVSTIVGDQAAQQWIANGRRGLPPEQAAQAATALLAIQSNPDIPLTVQQVATPDGGTAPAYFAAPQSMDVNDLYARIAQQPAHLQADLYTWANQEVARRDTVATLQREEDEAAAWQHIVGGGTIQGLPPALLARLDPTYINTLSSAASNFTRGGSVHPAQSDTSAYYFLRRMESEDLVGVNLLNWAPRLSMADFQELTKLQEEIEGRLAGAPMGPTEAYALTENEIFDTTLGRFGYVTNPTNSAERQEYYGLQDAWRGWMVRESAIRAARGENPRITQAEMREQLELYLIEGVNGRKFFEQQGAIDPRTGGIEDIDQWGAVRTMEDFEGLPQIVHTERTVVGTDRVTGQPIYADMEVTSSPAAYIARLYQGLLGAQPDEQQVVDTYNLALRVLMSGNSDATRFYSDGDPISEGFRNYVQTNYNREPTPADIQATFGFWILNFIDRAPAEWAEEYRLSVRPPPASAANFTGFQQFIDNPMPPPAGTPAVATTPAVDPGEEGVRQPPRTITMDEFDARMEGQPPANAGIAGTREAPVPQPPTDTGRAGTRENTNDKTAGSDDKVPLPISYTVQAGDTLWEIAQDFLGDGTRYRELMTLNNITNTQTLQIGQTLSLPGETAGVSEPGVPLPRPRPDASPAPAVPPPRPRPEVEVPLPRPRPTTELVPPDSSARWGERQFRGDSVTGRDLPTPDFSAPPNFASMTMEQLANWRQANPGEAPPAWEEAMFRRRHEALIIINQNAQRPYPIPNRPLTRQQVEAANVPPEESSTLTVAQRQQYIEERGMRTEPAPLPGNGVGVATEPVVRSGLDDLEIPPEPLTDTQRLDAAAAERGPIVGAPDATTAQPVEAQPGTLAPENIPIPDGAQSLTDLTREDINRVMEYILANKPERSQLSTGTYLIQLLAARFGTTEELVRNYLNTR